MRYLSLALYPCPLWRLGTERDTRIRGQGPPPLAPPFRSVPPRSFSAPSPLIRGSLLACRNLDPQHRLLAVLAPLGEGRLDFLFPLENPPSLIFSRSSYPSIYPSYPYQPRIASPRLAYLLHTPIARRNHSIYLPCVQFSQQFTDHLRCFASTFTAGRLTSPPPPARRILHFHSHTPPVCLSADSIERDIHSGSASLQPVDNYATPSTLRNRGVWNGNNQLSPIHLYRQTSLAIVRLKVCIPTLLPACWSPSSRAISSPSSPCFSLSSPTVADIKVGAQCVQESICFTQDVWRQEQCSPTRAHCDAATLWSDVMPSPVLCCSPAHPLFLHRDTVVVSRSARRLRDLASHGTA
jgi:hypothetical protein